MGSSQVSKMGMGGPQFLS